MAAVAPLRPDPATSPVRRVAFRPAWLKVVPPPRPRRSPTRDLAWATTLAVLLAVGIVGVLLLNTATQTQADRIAATKQQLADLTLKAQVLRTQADEVAAPAALAARARALDLRPATRVYVLPAAQGPLRVMAAPRRRHPHPVSAPAPAARPARAG